MSKGILFALLMMVAMFSTAGFASQIIFYPNQDTWVDIGNNDDHSTDVNLTLLSSGSPPYFVRGGYSRFNATNFSDVIFTNNTYTINFSTTGIHSLSVRWLDNTTWDQTSGGLTISQNLVGTFLCVMSPTPPISYHGETKTFDCPLLFTENPKQVADMYLGKQFSMVMTGSDTFANMRDVSSIEGGSPAYITLNTAHQITYLSQNTDIPSVVYVDFESGKVSTTIFAEFDVAIYPASYFYVAQVPSAFSSVDYDDSNSANFQSCGGLTAWAPPSTIVSNINEGINLNPDDKREIFCFNMSSAHQGKPYFGAIKFLDLTNSRGGAFHEADMYITLYGANVTTISNLQTSSNNVANSFIPFLWTTNQPATSVVWYKYTSSLALPFSDWVQLSNGSYVTNHNMLYLSPFGSPAGYYQAYATSTFGDSTSLSTPILNFSLSVPPVETGLGVTNGIFIKVINEGFVPIEATVAFDDVSPTGTSRMPDNDSATGYSQVAAYYGFNNTNHTVSVYKTGYSFFQLNFTVPSQPYFVTARIIPKNTCIEIYRATTNETCGANTLLLMKQSVLNYTNWYCDFDPNACTAYDNVTGGCLKSGMWKGYGCLDNYVPACGAINATCAIGSSGGVGGAFDVIAALFGTNTDGAKGLIAMIIIAAITIFVAFKVKDGLVTGIIGLMMVGVFGVIGWVPIWLIILLVIAVAFLIAKFVRQAMTPQ